MFLKSHREGGLCGLVTGRGGFEHSCPFIRGLKMLPVAQALAGNNELSLGVQGWQWGAGRERTTCPPIASVSLANPQVPPTPLHLRDT